MAVEAIAAHTSRSATPTQSLEQGLGGGNAGGFASLLLRSAAEMSQQLTSAGGSSLPMNALFAADPTQARGQTQDRPSSFPDARAAAERSATPTDFAADGKAIASQAQAQATHPPRRSDTASDATRQADEAAADKPSRRSSTTGETNRTTTASGPAPAATRRRAADKPEDDSDNDKKTSSSPSDPAGTSVPPPTPPLPPVLGVLPAPAAAPAGEAGEAGARQGGGTAAGQAATPVPGNQGTNPQSAADASAAAAPGAGASVTPAVLAAAQPSAGEQQSPSNPAALQAAALSQAAGPNRGSVKVSSSPAGSGDAPPAPGGLTSAATVVTNAAPLQPMPQGGQSFTNSGTNSGTDSGTDSGNNPGSDPGADSRSLDAAGGAAKAADDPGAIFAFGQPATLVGGDDVAQAATVTPLAAPGPVQGTIQSAVPTAPSAAQGVRQPVPPSPAEQLKIQMGRSLKDGSDTISVQLHPEDLGRVDVKLEMQNGQVKATVTADKPETLQMLKNDAAGLQQSLQDAGLKTDASSLTFQLRGDQQQQQRQFAQEGGGNARRDCSAPDDESLRSAIAIQAAASPSASGSASGLDISV